MTPVEKTTVRNETLQEITDWLRDCLTHVNPDSEVHKAITSVAAAIEEKKS